MFVTALLLQQKVPLCVGVVEACTNNLQGSLGATVGLLQHLVHHPINDK